MLKGEKKDRTPLELHRETCRAYIHISHVLRQCSQVNSGTGLQYEVIRYVPNEVLDRKSHALVPKLYRRQGLGPNIPA